MSVPQAPHTLPTRGRGAARPHRLAQTPAVPCLPPPLWGTDGVGGHLDTQTRGQP